MDSPATSGSLTVSFSPHSGDAFPVGLPVLSAAPVESIFAGAVPCGHSGDFALFRDGPWLLGRARVAPGSDLAQTSAQLYGQLLDAARGWHLARIWNYVPAINAPGPGGLEHYRAFSQGRALAFERVFGPDFKRAVPAASAVGCDAAELSVLFAATHAPVRHVENPDQIPAYNYPPEYGPRAPSFARATLVLGEQTDVFISGTAAVRGHATVAPGNTSAQLDCTLENLRTISLACGLGAHLAAGTAAARHFKIYLRHPADLAAVADRLTRDLLRPDDRVSYLRSDICRSDLNLEIEATLRGLAPA